MFKQHCIQLFQQQPCMFAIDANLLVYAYNLNSPFHEKSAIFVETAMNFKNNKELPICATAQTFSEFCSVITWQGLESPLSFEQALSIVDYFISSGIPIVHQQQTQVNTFSKLLSKHPSRKKLFDIALTATLKDNDISGIYTVNTKDFDKYDFLTVINPLKDA